MAISPGTDRNDPPARAVHPIVVPDGRRPGRAPRGNGRLRGLLVVGAVLTGIVIASLAIPHPEPVLGERAPTVPGVAPAATTSAPLPAGPTPLLAPDGDQPDSGPGVDRPGTVQIVKVGPDGVLLVTEQAVPGPGAGGVLDLRLPSMAALGGQVAALAPVVGELRASVDGIGVLPEPTADGPGWALPVPEGTVVVRVSYRLEGASVRTPSVEPGTAPADPGRVVADSGKRLAVSLPLLGDALRRRGLPLTVRVPGPGISGLTCPSAPPAEMLCGQEEDGAWTAPVPSQAATPAVLVQLAS